MASTCSHCSSTCACEQMDDMIFLEVITFARGEGIVNSSFGNQIREGGTGQLTHSELTQTIRSALHTKVHATNMHESSNYGIHFSCRISLMLSRLGSHA